MSEVHGLRIKELLDAKAQGRKVIATFCVYIPEEIALATDAVQVGLCVAQKLDLTSQRSISTKHMFLDQIIFWILPAKICRYFEASDLVVGENTCDGKKKAYEIFKDLRNLYVMDLPNMKHEHGRELLK